jgi:hypothetical protein
MTINWLKRLSKKTFNYLGYEIQLKRLDGFPVEFDSRDREILEYVIGKKLTMVTRERLFATVAACKYVLENDIDGDFVECGVWKGGNALAAKLIFESHRSDKAVILFDTFSGMTEPNDNDKDKNGRNRALEGYLRHMRGEQNEWCRSPLEEVKAKFADAGVDFTNVRFVVGDVCNTLRQPHMLPGKISILRLDTDWYDSTKMEMEVLYPLLVEKGVLLIDDYGHWEGARKAIDEYFHQHLSFKPMLHYTDRTGRTAIKTL